MTGNEFQKAAMRTAGEYKSDLVMLLNGVMGLHNKSRDCLHILGIRLGYGHPFDYESMTDELGDVAWYLAVCAEALGIGLDDIFLMNIEKLKKRYPDGFSSERSINREG